MREAALGPNHPEVAACVNNLAVLLKTLGRYEEAQNLYESSIAIKERSMGPTHPQVLCMVLPLRVASHLSAEHNPKLPAVYHHLCPYQQGTHTTANVAHTLLGL